MKVYKAILRAIAEHIEQHSYPPTLDELQHALNLSAADLQAKIRQLQRAKYVKRMPATERWLYLMRRGWTSLDEEHD